MPTKTKKRVTRMKARPQTKLQRERAEEKAHALAQRELGLQLRIAVAEGNPSIYSLIGMDAADVKRLIRKLQKQLKTVQQDPHYRVFEPYGA